MSKNRFELRTVNLMFIIIISKLFGMLRDVVLANYFGTSSISDAYLIANSVPTLLFYFIGHSLATAYIPMYNKVCSNDGSKRAQKYSNNVMNIALILCVIIVIILTIFPNFVVRLFASGFDEDTTSIAVNFIRICTPSIFIMTIVYVLTGYLQSNSSFLVPAAVSLPRNFVLIISVILAFYINIDILGWGLLISYIAELLLLMPFAIRKGYKYKLELDIKDEYLKDTFSIVVPIILGLCVSQVNKIIDRSIASTIIEGGISALTYASIINSAVQEVLVTGIITILFADCSKLVSENKHEQVKKKISETISTMLFLLIPATIGIIILAEPIVKVILYRGNFNSDSITLTTGALCCYTVGLTFLALRDTLVKVFYAYKDTKITTITSIISILINIVLNLILSQFWGINGLAIATSISSIFNSIVLYILLRKKIGDFGIRNLSMVAFKTIIAAFAMAIVVYYIFKLLEMYITVELLNLVISVLVGMISFLIFSLILRNPIIYSIYKKTK